MDHPYGQPAPLAPLGGETRVSTTPIKEAANLQPITVQKYADSDTIKISEEGYPAILRTDKPYSLSIHSDDVEAFTRLRNNIGVKIYLARFSVQFFLRKNEILPLSGRLIHTLEGHGIKISNNGDDWRIEWKK